jgi:hypothetical protein
MLMALTGSLPAGTPAWQAGLITAAKGIQLHSDIWDYVQTLPNQPPGGYQIAYEINSVGNTLNTANSGSGNACPWWIDNTTYGPVTAGAGTTGQHGGLWYGTGSPGGLWLRLDNANVLNDMRVCLVAWWAGCEALGKHIYCINPFQELSIGGVPPVQAGISNASFIAGMGGTTGIPNGFVADVRNGISNTLIQVMSTFTNGGGSPGGFTAMQQLLNIFCPHFWSISPFDGSNITTPPDYVAAGQTSKNKSSWGELSFCGQTAVNGPVVSTNWRDLGYDSHHHTVADELGGSFILGNNAVLPPAGEGNGRIPDILSGATYKHASHFFPWMEFFTGPRCNTVQPYAGGQPANYAFPLVSQGGSTVTFQSIMQSLDYTGFNADSYLQLSYPSAFP